MLHLGRMRSSKLHLIWWSFLVLKSEAHRFEVYIRCYIHELFVHLLMAFRKMLVYFQVVYLLTECSRIRASVYAASLDLDDLETTTNQPKLLFYHLFPTCRLYI